jgi:hypothetical protein
VTASVIDVNPWEQLMEGIDLPFHPDLTIPSLTEVALPIPQPDPVDDVEAAAHSQVVQKLAGSVRAGMTVAVGAGSRGLVERVPLLRGAISGLRELGSMLESLGMTEAAIDCEIRATMETVEVARTADGMPLYLDRNAAGADRIMPVNRIKPHTCFKGPIESGLTKMAVVGFGKQPGAAQIHACGPVEMRNRLLNGIDALKKTGRLLGGVGSLESADGQVVNVRALTGEEVGSEAEITLTDDARDLVPPLPFDVIDVLIIEQGGKDISGTTMDPNVTGRFWVHGLADSESPRVSTIVLLGITEVSGGNVLGIGFADFIPASVAAGINWQKTYVNCFTAGPSGVRRSRMPMVLPTEDDCLKAALSMCGKAVDEPKNVVRIRSTLHLTKCWVSEPLLSQLPAGATVL